MSAKWMYHVFPEEYATSLISCCFYGYIMGATGIFFVILDENHGISGYTQVWWLVTSIILYLPIRYFWKRYIVKSKTCDRIIKNADEYKGLCNALFSLFFCIFGIYAPVIILGIDQFLSKWHFNLSEWPALSRLRLSSLLYASYAATSTNEHVQKDIEYDLFSYRSNKRRWWLFSCGDHFLRANIWPRWTLVLVF